MTDSELEQRLEQMFSGTVIGRPAETDLAWRQFVQARRRSSRTRRQFAAAGAACVIAVATVVGAALGHHFAGNAPRSEPDQGAGGGHLAITARIPQPGVGSAPGDMTMAANVVSQNGAVWGITYADYLFKIDQRTDHVTYREHIAGLTDVAAGGGSIWALIEHRKSSRLVRLDPVTGRVVKALQMSRACGLVRYAGGELWLACSPPGRSVPGVFDFIRLDPATGRVLADTGTVHGVFSVAASPDGIWYAAGSGVAGFIDAGAGLRWVRVNDSGYPIMLIYTQSLVYGQGALWALSSDESVAKIDPATGRITRAYSSAAYDPSNSLALDFVTVGLHSLWFLSDSPYEATSVLRVSMTTGRPQGMVSGVGSCGEPCMQIYFARDSIWVPTQTHITRVEPR
jgi:hypothetical protein